MKLSEYAFHEQIERLMELPGGERSLRLSNTDTSSEVELRYTPKRELWVLVDETKLSSEQVAKAHFLMKDRADRTPDLLKFKPSEGLAGAHIDSNNEFTAGALVFDLFTELFHLPEGTDLQVSKDYEDYDAREAIKAAIANLPAPKSVLVESGTTKLLVNQGSIEFSIKKIEANLVDLAEEWFAAKGWSLWDHDNGTCPQLMGNEGVEAYDKLQLFFTADADRAARFAYDFFISIARLPINFRAKISIE